MKFPKNPNNVTPFPSTLLLLLFFYLVLFDLFYLLKKKRKRCTWGLKILKIPKLWPKSQMGFSPIPRGNHADGLSLHDYTRYRDV